MHIYLLLIIKFHPFRYQQKKTKRWEKKTPKGDDVMEIDENINPEERIVDQPAPPNSNFPVENHFANHRNEENIFGQDIYRILNENSDLKPRELDILQRIVDLPLHRIERASWTLLLLKQELIFHLVNMQYY